MLLIYSENTSPRLQYICKFIFAEILGIAYNITLHKESFTDYDGPKINYSRQDALNGYTIKPALLLFESIAVPQDLKLSGNGETTQIFCTQNADHSFDVFAAVFYLISRYEEYLPHELDMYGRFAHKNSIAFTHGFLHIPVVNIWIRELGEKLKRSYPALTMQMATFRFQPTYDIDIAWSYKEKGFLRNLGGFIMSPSIGRLTAWIGMQDDPFNSYQFLDDLHISNQLKPLYFFLVAKENGVYDKNILPSNQAMQRLIKEHGAKYKLGIHPSWKSNEEPLLLKEEKIKLEDMSGQSISVSRQHYIKMSLPETYRELISAGITADYSMGYGSINGFRASVASSFLWYDLKAEKISTLRVHPFCFMDANSFYEEKLSVDEAFDELMEYYLICKKVSGTLITIFHNNFLGTANLFKGWRERYTKFISQVQ